MISAEDAKKILVKVSLAHSAKLDDERKSVVYSCRGSSCSRMFHAFVSKTAQSAT
jgi:hypothetical protein